MRPQRKIMMVETTHAFVKLKQIKAAVSAGGIQFNQMLSIRSLFIPSTLSLNHFPCNISFCFFAAAFAAAFSFCSFGA